MIVNTPPPTAKIPTERIIDLRHLEPIRQPRAAAAQMERAFSLSPTARKDFRASDERRQIA